MDGFIARAEIGGLAGFTDDGEAECLRVEADRASEVENVEVDVKKTVVP
jgi:hypothetical protein